MVYSRRIIESKHNLGASFNIKSKSLELRKIMTEAEEILWSRLRKRQQSGMYFRRQHPYNIYILDFYCFNANLAIEVDGEIHERTIEYDAGRTRFLESSGLTVLRFTNNDIKKRIEWVLSEINKHLMKSTSS